MIQRRLFSWLCALSPFASLSPENAALGLPGISSSSSPVFENGRLVYRNLDLVFSKTLVVSELPFPVVIDRCNVTNGAPLKSAILCDGEAESPLLIVTNTHFRTQNPLGSWFTIGGGK